MSCDLDNVMFHDPFAGVHGQVDIYSIEGSVRKGRETRYSHIAAVKGTSVP